MSPPLPDLSNGKTCGYYVCYGISSSFSLNTSEEIHVFANTTIFNSTTFVDSTTKIIISNLRKYAVYEVYVAAFTVFGHGPKGNYSHRTLQDGE